MSNVVPQQVGHKRNIAARQIRLRLVSLDVWSVVKYAFLLSLCWAIIGIVVSIFIYLALTQTGVLGKADEVFSQIISDKGKLSDFLGIGNILVFSIVTGFVDILVGTALGAVFAILYNQIAKMTGGLSFGFSNQ